MSSNPILLIEDNADDADLTLRALRRNNIANEIVVLHDGAEALEWLSCSGAYAGRDPAIVPALVLLDLKLPRVDGLQVLQHIRAQERSRFYPVVILTSSDEQRDIVESYRLGVNSYVRKPVDFAAFTDAVKVLGLYWLVLNRRPEAPRA